MKIVNASIAALALVGFVAGTSAATACELMKTAKASPAPVEEELAAPASSIDPVMLAEIADPAILPRAPEETEAE